MYHENGWFQSIEVRMLKPENYKPTEAKIDKVCFLWDNFCSKMNILSKTIVWKKLVRWSVSIKRKFFELNYEKTIEELDVGFESVKTKKYILSNNRMYSFTNNHWKNFIRKHYCSF